MSLPDVIAAEKVSKLKSTAQQMLNGNLNLIEGVRIICSLRHATEDPENPAFLSLRAIESETDHLPLGDERQSCSKDYLEKIDIQIENFIADAKDDILAACREILHILK